MTTIVERMSASPWRVRGIVFAAAGLIVTMLTAGGLTADGLSASSAAADPSKADQIQAQLNEARQQANTLQRRSAQAAEAYNGAVIDLTEAKERAAKAQRGLDKARRQFDAEQAKVAALTLEDLQSSSAMNRMSSLFDAQGPVELLQRNTTYASAQDAMAATMDRLEASQQIFRAAQKRATAARQKQERLVTERSDARAAIVAAADKAKKQEEQIAQRRDALIRKLADARDISIRKARQHQDVVDRRIDRGESVDQKSGDSPRTRTRHESRSSASPSPQTSSPENTSSPKNTS